MGHAPRRDQTFLAAAQAALEALRKLALGNAVDGARESVQVGAVQEAFSATRDLLLRREALPAALRRFALGRAELNALEAMTRATTTKDLKGAILQAQREDHRPQSPGEVRWSGAHLTLVLEALLRARAAEAERGVPTAGQASRTLRHRMAARQRAGARLMELAAFIGNPVSRADTPLVPTEEAWARALARLKTEAMPPEAYQALLRQLPSTRRGELRAFSRARPDLFTFEQLDAIAGPWRCPPEICGAVGGVRLDVWREGLMRRDAAVEALQQITATVLRGSGTAPPSAMLWPNKRAVLALDDGSDRRILGFIHYDASGVLDELAVLPAATRPGLGDRLLLAAITDLRRLGHRSIAFNIAAADELRPGVASPLGFYQRFAARHPGFRFQQGRRAVGMMPGSFSVIEF